MINHFQSYIQQLEDQIEEYEKYFQHAVIYLRKKGFDDETIADVLCSTIEEVKAVKEPEEVLKLSTEESLTDEVKKLRSEGKTEDYIRDFSEGYRIGYGRGHRQEIKKFSKRLLRAGMDPKKVALYSGEPYHTILEWQEEPELDYPSEELISAMKEAERIANDPSAKTYTDIDELFSDIEK